MPRKKKADIELFKPTEGIDRDQWPDVPLAWVFMFRDYLRYASPLHRAQQAGASIRPTFRDYIDGDAPVGTHRFLVKIVDRLEDRLGRLFIAREYRAVNGNMTVVTTKSQIESLPTRPKRNGAPTVDGEAMNSSPSWSKPCGMP